MKKLNIEIMRGFGKTRRRGTECGGVLLGSKASDTLTIQDFKIVSCEYAFGPSYRLSESDEQAFQDAVTNAGASVVGFFRSNTRDDLTLDDSDRRLLSKLPASQRHVALLLTPFVTKSPIARFFFPSDDGTLNSTREFPFSPKLNDAVEEVSPAAAAASAAADSAAPAAVQAAAPVETRTTAPSNSPESMDAPAELVAHDEDDLALSRVLGRNFASTPSMVPQRMDAPTFGGLSLREVPSKSGLNTAILAVLFTALTLITGGLSGFQIAGGRVQLTPNIQFKRPDPTQAWVLGLTVAPAGDRVRVTWNPESAAAQEATSGKLMIADGTAEPKVIEMPATEIRNGGVLHFPTTNRVRFTLDLQLPNRRGVSETAEWSR